MATITVQQLQQLFHLPLKQAAVEAGVCATVFKRVCREHGIPRWPYRKVASVDKRLKAARQRLQSEGPTEAARAELASLQAERAAIVRAYGGGSSGAASSPRSTVMAALTSSSAKPGFKRTRGAVDRTSPHAATYMDDGSDEEGVEAQQQQHWKAAVACNHAPTSSKQRGGMSDKAHHDDEDECDHHHDEDLEEEEEEEEEEEGVVTADDEAYADDLHASSGRPYRRRRSVLTVTQRDLPPLHLPATVTGQPPQRTPAGVAQCTEPVVRSFDEVVLEAAREAAVRAAREELRAGILGAAAGHAAGTGTHCVCTCAAGAGAGGPPVAPMAPTLFDSAEDRRQTAMVWRGHNTVPPPPPTHHADADHNAIALDAMDASTASASSGPSSTFTSPEPSPGATLASAALPMLANGVPTDAHGSAASAASSVSPSDHHLDWAFTQAAGTTMLPTGNQRNLTLPHTPNPVFSDDVYFLLNAFAS